ncbi:DUF4381 domain-containing protein [Primorskyibacter sp. S87]|uniref:DUF4381 domain-containing protein n=1 Tax=Primorskyibacter sp. S87 TaxID=3415126 RepID=UPI003C7DC240
MSDATPSSSPVSDDLSGKSLVELLDMLAPMPAPPPVSMVPQTTGWLVLAVLVVALAIWLILRWRAHTRREAYRKAALAELQQTGDDVARIAAVLRRAALAGFQREQVAGLTGSAWLGFLGKSCPGLDMSSQAAQALTTAPYRGSSRDPAVTELARRWIRNHRREQP